MEGLLIKLVALALAASFVVCQHNGDTCQPPNFIPEGDEVPLIYYASDDHQCDKFHSCTFSTRLVKTSFLCEDGLVFDGYRCILPHGVDCKGRELLQPPQPSGVCLRQNGIYKVAESCNEYYHCSRGVASRFTCAGTLIFDESKGVCAHPDQVEVKSADCSESVRYGFTCPIKAGHHVYRSPHDCRAFFTCSYPFYRPHLGGCPFDTVFNESTQRCDEPQNVPGCEKYYEEKDS